MGRFYWGISYNYHLCIFGEFGFDFVMMGFFPISRCWYSTDSLTTKIISISFNQGLYDCGSLNEVYSNFIGKVLEIKCEVILVVFAVSDWIMAGPMHSSSLNLKSWQNNTQKKKLVLIALAFLHPLIVILFSQFSLLSIHFIYFFYRGLSKSYILTVRFFMSLSNVVWYYLRPTI